MNPDMTILVIVAAVLLLMASGYPIAFGLISIAVLGCWAFAGVNSVGSIYLTLFGSMTKDIYISIPLFVFMAGLLEVSGVGKNMYDVMNNWLGEVRGGLAIGTIAICTLIAAMTGLSGTGTLITGMIAYPEMRKRGYDKSLAIGVVPSGGALGPLIPPSIPNILVGGMTGISVGKLFMAGLLPGIACALAFIMYIVLICHIRPSVAPKLSREDRPSLRFKLASSVKLLSPLALISLVLGTIYTGVATPTEAAAMGATGALLIGVISRNITWSNLRSAVTSTYKITAMCMWLVLGGSAFSSLCGVTGVKVAIYDFVAVLPFGSMGIFILIMVLIFIMGMFIETASILMVVIPILGPLNVILGFDPVWFFFMIAFNAIIGTITPPFGYGLFFFHGLGHKDVSIADIYKAVIPFCICMAIVLTLCTIFPEIVLWIPRMME
ncbi:MAG: TRAP transporter large permease subunit [Deltaproteobacteria bacterium]